jgi:hypothetical protein
MFLIGHIRHEIQLLRSKDADKFFLLGGKIIKQDKMIKSNHSASLESQSRQMIDQGACIREKWLYSEQEVSSG